MNLVRIVDILIYLLPLLLFSLIFPVYIHKFFSNRANAFLSPRSPVTCVILAKLICIDGALVSLFHLLPSSHIPCVGFLLPHCLLLWSILLCAIRRAAAFIITAKRCKELMKNPFPRDTNGVDSITVMNGMFVMLLCMHWGLVISAFLINTHAWDVRISHRECVDISQTLKAVNTFLLVFDSVLMLKLALSIRNLRDNFHIRSELCVHFGAVIFGVICSLSRMIPAVSTHLLGRNDVFLSPLLIYVIPFSTALYISLVWVFNYAENEEFREKSIDLEEVTEFVRVWKDRRGLALLKEFFVRELNVGEFLFYLSVMEWEKSAESVGMSREHRRECVALFNTFVRADAALALDLTDVTRNEAQRRIVNENCDSTTSKVFSSVCEEVLRNLMCKRMRRFWSSDMYAEWKLLPTPYA